MKGADMKIRTKRSGFTLVETLAVLGIVALVGVQVAPMQSKMRGSARGQTSATKLTQIGQGSAMYALDNGGRIFNFTWRGPERPGGERVGYILPNGQQKFVHDHYEAIQWQDTEILMRRTGRTEHPDKILRNATRLPQPRGVHIVLMDYMNLPFPSDLFADPADLLLAQWQANPTDLSVANNIPYMAPAGPGYDSPTGWTTTAARQRWPFTSSYLTTVSAWSADGIAGESTWVPVAETPHVFSLMPDSTPSYKWSRALDNRFYFEVASFSGKVHMFEEFDREQAGSPYFAYDHARPEKLMFDGSVNSWASGDANTSWNPTLGKTAEWRQTYVPLDQFPVPLSGLGEQIELSQQYRWTRFGLRGIDYSGRR